MSWLRYDHPKGRAGDHLIYLRPHSGVNDLPHIPRYDLYAEEATDCFSAPLREPGPPIGINRQIIQKRGQGGDVSFREHFTAAGDGDHPGDLAAVRAQYSDTTGQCFDENAAELFFPGRRAA